MSEFLREFRSRIDELVKPHREVYGDDAPVVRFATKIMAEAEAVEESMKARRVGTIEAAERTGWAAETLQKYAKAKVKGHPIPETWAGLEVEETSAGYVFVLGSIPENPRRAA